ncbi:MAG: adenylosuccinate lyase [Chloroflexi bacterium]|nr:adenylosuccinate lyase [Chloroflexota bacterium]
MIERYSRPEMKAIWTDQNKFDNWLRIEIAVCEAWVELDVIPKEELPKIKKAVFNLKKYDEVLKETHHDVTAFLRVVAETIGPESRFIHMGLTSSDIMDTALSLQLVQASKILRQGMVNLTQAVVEKSLMHKKTIMMGRTHGVHAEPTTFGLKLAVWVEEMKRNLHRLDEAEKTIAVGKISGAVGTYATVPPEIEAVACARLCLAPDPVSTQIVQRDRHAQYLTTLAIIASSLEKFALEIRGLQRTEVLEAEEPFAEGQTGSSAMPHKRNPELCERVCGLARLVRGYSLTSLENIALWHERDISHSSTERITFPDACLVLDYMLDIFTGVMRGLLVYPDRMRQNLEITQGLVFSQRVLLALIEKGLTRQKAYAMVQRNAMRAWKERVPFIGLLAADPEVSDYLSRTDLEKLFDYNYFLRHVDTVFDRLKL